MDETVELVVKCGNHEIRVSMSEESANNYISVWVALGESNVESDKRQFMHIEGRINPVMQIEGRINPAVYQTIKCIIPVDTIHLMWVTKFTTKHGRGSRIDGYGRAVREE